MLVLLLMVTSTGARRCFAAMRRIGRGHGRREQRHLPLRRGLLENAFYGIDETHRQHFVGFIEHQQREPAELQGAAIHVIDDASGRANHHVRTTLQGVQLRLVALAAVDRQHVKALDMRSIFEKRLGHLQVPVRASAPAPTPEARAWTGRYATARAAQTPRSCPFPVCAWPSMSFPASSTGMVAAWMGEGDS